MGLTTVVVLWVHTYLEGEALHASMAEMTMEWRNLLMGAPECVMMDPRQVKQVRSMERV